MVLLCHIIRISFTKTIHFVIVVAFIKMLQIAVFQGKTKVYGNTKNISKDKIENNFH